jgi:hypothetical protein
LSCAPPPCVAQVFAALLEQSGQLWKAKQAQQAPDYEE